MLLGRACQWIIVMEIVAVIHEPDINVFFNVVA
jgi:hypothetical protein